MIYQKLVFARAAYIYSLLSPAEVIQDPASKRIEVLLIGITEELPLSPEIIDPLSSEIRQKRKRPSIGKQVNGCI